MRKEKRAEFEEREKGMLKRGQKAEGTTESPAAMTEDTGAPSSMAGGD